MATTEPKLTIEMIPQPLMGVNARAVLTAHEWNVVREHVYEQAGYRCEACGERGRHHPVEAHEVWVYDDAVGVQMLARIAALCPDCHNAVHYGLATKLGRATQAARQLQHVNDWTVHQVGNHIIESWDRWYARNHRDDWQVDMSQLVGLYLELTGHMPTFMEEPT